jgi:hypothetical protein
MSLNQDFTAILSKEMDRKDFIKHIAIGVVALTGLATVVKALAPAQKQSPKSSGYGGAPYGGSKDS